MFVGGTLHRTIDRGQNIQGDRFSNPLKYVAVNTSGGTVEQWKDRQQSGERAARSCQKLYAVLSPLTYVSVVRRAAGCDFRVRKLPYGYGQTKTKWNILGKSSLDRPLSAGAQASRCPRNSRQSRNASV